MGNCSLSPVATDSTLPGKHTVRSVMASNTALLNLAKLMKSGDFSDLTFSCNGEELKVHKNVVCGQSPVIKAALSKYFEEGHSNVIKMDEFELQIVKRFVEFLYTGEYDVPEEGEADDGSDDDDGRDEAKVVGVADVEDGNDGDDGDDSDQVVEGDKDEGGKDDYSQVADAQSRMIESLATHIKVNSIGDYYGVPNLVSLANSKISDLIEEGDEDKDSGTWVTNLPSAINLTVGNTGDKDILKILSAEAAENISHLILSESFRDLEVVSDFAFHVLEGCAETIQDLTIRNNELEAKLLRQKEELLHHKEEGNMFPGLYKHLNDTTRCRHCSNNFGSYFDHSERVIRCRVCQTRHYHPEPVRISS